MIKPWQKYLVTITLSCCSAIKDNQHQTERDKKAIDLIIWKKKKKKYLQINSRQWNYYLASDEISVNWNVNDV